jgi:hypothetical protein
VAYERHSIKLNEKASALYSEFSDAVLFMSQKVYIKTDNNKVKAYGEGERILVTEQRPSHLAKNRFGLPYEIQAPKGGAYRAIAQAMGLSEIDKIENIKTSIEEMIEMTPANLKDKVKASYLSAGNNPEKLMAIRNRLVELTKQ